MYYVAGGKAIASVNSTDGGETWTQDPGWSLGEGFFRADGTMVRSGPDSEDFLDPAAAVVVEGTVNLYFGHGAGFFNCQIGGGERCGAIRMARSSNGVDFVLAPGDVLTPGTGVQYLADPNVYRAPDGG